MSKTKNDYQASIKILKANIGLFHNGLKETYRVVATELRKMLCEKNRSLLTRVYSDAKLHKLHWTGVLERCPSLAEGLQVLTPGRLSFDGNGNVRFSLSFDKSLQLISLEDWIKQPIFSPEITIRDLIKSVADKEGAHSDPEYNETLLRVKLVKYLQDDSHMHLIVGIGEYILSLEENNSFINQ